MTMQLEKPAYGEDFINDAMLHIRAQKSSFDCYLKSESAHEVANCLTVLCLKIIAMLTSMLTAQLRDFRQQGGFAENLTQARVEAKREQAVTEGSPACPVCGKPMFRRTVQRGTRQGEQFWGCSDYPRCNGTRNFK